LSFGDFKIGLAAIQVFDSNILVINDWAIKFFNEKSSAKDFARGCERLRGVKKIVRNVAHAVGEFEGVGHGITLGTVEELSQSTALRNLEQRGISRLEWLRRGWLG
jgi:hypothetical protein